MAIFFSESLLTGLNRRFYQEIMKLHYKEELDRAVDLALAVFHLDIETCTEVLLTAVLPQYLHNVTT